MYEEFQSNKPTTFIWTNTQIVVDDKIYTWKVSFKDGLTVLKNIDKYVIYFVLKI